MIIHELNIADHDSDRVVQFLKFYDDIIQKGRSNHHEKSPGAVDLRSWLMDGYKISAAVCIDADRVVGIGFLSKVSLMWPFTTEVSAYGETPTVENKIFEHFVSLGEAQGAHCLVSISTESIVSDHRFQSAGILKGVFGREPGAARDMHMFEYLVKNENVRREI